MKTSYEKVSFSSDGLVLNGTLHIPEIKNPPVVIGSHGLLTDGNSPKQVELARKCSENNIAYFRFDHRGCGKSQGIFKEGVSLELRYNDFANAVKTIQARPDLGDKIGFFGSSLGGSVCMVAASVFKVDAIVIFAAPVRADSTITSFDKLKNEDPFMPKFDHSTIKFDISEKLSNLSNIMIFHGDSDNLVTLSNSQQVYAGAREPKELIIQKGGDHRMSNRKHQKEFVNKSVAWFKKLLI
jgi:alpha-beta hydrolase superfamily lysophospholipase